jgi:simple sugar transport system substrate-binding protein
MFDISNNSPGEEKRIVSTIEAGEVIERLEYEDTPDQPGLERRRFLRNTALAGGGSAALASLLAACGANGGGGDSGSGSGNFPKTRKFRFVFVCHVTTNPFFVPTQYGIEDACALVGASSQWTGSKTAKVSEMLDAFNTAVTSKADGIAIPLVDPKAFNSPVEKALGQGIPVMAYNADVPPPKNKRLCYIGQDLFLSGVEMGNRIVSLVPSGDVALFIATPGALNIQPRIDGAISAIKKSGKPINYKSIATGAEVNEELSRVDAYYLGHKDVKGMFAVDAGTTQALGQVMKKYKLAGKVKAGGFDTLPKILEALQAGDLDFSIDQQAYLQGFLPVLQLFLYKISGTLTGVAEVNTGLKFVTKDSADIYVSNPSRFEGSTKEQKVINA